MGGSVKRCLTCASQRRYETDARRYAMLAARLEQIARDPSCSTSTPMKLVVALSGPFGLLSSAPSADDAPRAAAEAVGVAINEIYRRSAAARGGGDSGTFVGM